MSEPEKTEQPETATSGFAALFQPTAQQRAEMERAARLNVRATAVQLALAFGTSKSGEFGTQDVQDMLSDADAIRKYLEGSNADPS